MKKILLTFCALFLLSGCIPVETEKQTEPEEQVEPEKIVDVFKKNQECYKYKEGLEKEYPKNKNSGGIIEIETEIDAVFYSPKLDTCLYARFDTLSAGDSIAHTMDLIDVFTRNDVARVDTGEDTSLAGAAEFFREAEKLIKEYQK